MGAFKWDKWILLAAFLFDFLFQNYLGIIDHWSHVTNVFADQSPLFVRSTLIRKQWRHSDQRVYSYAVWSCCLYQLAFWDKQCNIWPGFNVQMQPGQCFLQSPIFCETAEIWSLHHFVSIFFRVLKIKLNFVKLTFRTAISSHQVMGMLSKKCEVWKMYHTEYGQFIATDWLKTKGSRRVMG